MIKVKTLNEIKQATHSGQPVFYAFNLRTAKR